MGWLSERRKAKEATKAQSLAEALVQALAQTAQSQSQMGAMVGGWIKELGDLSVRRSAALLGTRGGQRTQARLRARKAAAAQAACPLCDDANYRDVSVAMISAHRSHNGVSKRVVQGEMQLAPEDHSGDSSK